MPRKLTIEFPGTIYYPALSHFGATSLPSSHSGAQSLRGRGERREEILHEQGRRDFVISLADACQKSRWPVHTCRLMLNHFHLVVERPDANLVADMRWLLSGRTNWLNHCHNLFDPFVHKNHSGDLPKECRDAKSGRIEAEELLRLGGIEADSACRPKSNSAEQAFAARTRRETTLTIKQIAQVKLGTSKSANARLLRWTRNPALGNKAA